MSNRRKPGYRWLTLGIGLAAAATLYTLLRQKYHGCIRAVLFAFMYASILITVVDRIILSIPFLAELAPPILSVAELPFLKTGQVMTARTARNATAN